MRNSLMTAGVFLLSATFAGCSGSHGAPSVPQAAKSVPSSIGPALRAPDVRKPLDIIGGPSLQTVSTLLGDAAPVIGGKTVSHFYIGVREIDAIANGQSVVLGSATTPYQLDLLQYQNGSTDWMTQTSIPEQTYSQLRYVIDTNDTSIVFSDGTSLPVKFTGAPSYSSYGVGSNTTTTADPTYADSVDVTVDAALNISSTAAAAADFNLTESLYDTGSTIIVRPAISAAVSSGEISGTVLNGYGSGVKTATVVAVNSAGMAVNSATTDANGFFNIHALPADTYQLVVYNAYTNAAGYDVYSSGATYGGVGFYGPSVTVTAASTTSAGTIGD